MLIHDGPSNYSLHKSVSCPCRPLDCTSCYFGLLVLSAPSPEGSLSAWSGRGPSHRGVDKKHKYLPGIWEAATHPKPGLSFHRISMFLYSFLKSAANAVPKLMSAVMAIAHLLCVSLKSLSVNIMLLEY